MAISILKKEFIAKSFSYTFPAFSAGAVGSRIDYQIFDIGIDGYTPISAGLMPVYGGVTFTCSVSMNDTQAIVVRNRMGGNAETQTYNCTLKVLYQRNS